MAGTRKAKVGAVLFLRNVQAGLAAMDADLSVEIRETCQSRQRDLLVVADVLVRGFSKVLDEAVRATLRGTLLMNENQKRKAKG